MAYTERLGAEARGFDDSARTDPEILAEVRDGLLDAAAVGERLLEVIEELEEVASGLRTGLVPGFDDERFSEIRKKIFGLKNQIEGTFDGMRDSAENPTYLGNLATRHHLDSVREEERKAKIAAMLGNNPVEGQDSSQSSS